MAKKKVTRGAARRVRDKWRAKTWYTVRSPRMFNGAVVAETLTDEPEKLMGRVAEVTLQELTGDFTKMHVKLRFKVNSVKGADCWTKFTGHELTSDYVRRLTRRKHSKVDSVIDVRTSDGWTVRVKPLAITENRTKSSQQAEMRTIMQKLAQDAAGSRDIGAFVRDLVNGDLAQQIYKESRVVYPLKRVEIRKSEVVREPENFVPDVDVFPEPERAEEEEPTPSEEPEEAEGDADLAEAVGEELAGEASAESSEEEEVASEEESGEGEGEGEEEESDDEDSEEERVEAQ